MKRLLLASVTSLMLCPIINAQTAEIQKEVEDKLKSMRADDEVLRRALAMHPDILLAQAKVRVAEAELAQAKMLVTQKFNALKSEMEAQKSKIEVQSKLLEMMTQKQKAGQIPIAEIVPVQTKVAELKFQLSRMQVDYDGMTKPAETLSLIQRENTAQFTEVLNSAGKTDAAKNRQQFLGEFHPERLNGKVEQFQGSLRLERLNSAASEQLKSVLNRTIKFNAKEVPAAAILDEIRKPLGITFQIRIPDAEVNKKILHDISGEFEFSAVLQLVVDELNKEFKKESFYEIYVRDYGLLIVHRNQAPVDAYTLHEFVQQVRLEKAAATPK